MTVGRISSLSSTICAHGGPDAKSIGRCTWEIWKAEDGLTDGELVPCRAEFVRRHPEQEVCPLHADARRAQEQRERTRRNRADQEIYDRMREAK